MVILIRLHWIKLWFALNCVISFEFCDLLWIVWFALNCVICFEFRDLQVCSDIGNHRWGLFRSRGSKWYDKTQDQLAPLRGSLPTTIKQNPKINLKESPFYQLWTFCISFKAHRHDMQDGVIFIHIFLMNWLLALKGSLCQTYFCVNIYLWNIFSLRIILRFNGDFLGSYNFVGKSEHLWQPIITLLDLLSEHDIK